jgi:WD40 repeat protein/serine/threonine protein kinase
MNTASDASPTGRCSRCGASLQGLGSPHCPLCLLGFGIAGYDSGPPGDPIPGPPLSHRFGDYELLGEIARGGMGIVIRARQRRLNRLVALKLIAADGWRRDFDGRRFQAEAEAAARLEHPNIVPIFEVGEEAGQRYLCMKLIEGGNLAEAIAAAWKQGCDAKQQRDWARLLAVLAHAVHYAHQRGVLHRDLKPTNILLDREGQPHLTDFGLAKLLEANQAITLTGATMGTPGYMSPEQADGNQGAVTTAVDIYGLGAVLYCMLTGRAPFVGASPLQTLDLVRNSEVRPPRALNPQVDIDLETICLKCLSREPSRRYGSALALAEEMERFLAGEPILARPVGTAQRLWRWCRRKPALAGLGAALTVALIAGTSATAWQWRLARTASDAQRTANASLAATNTFLRLQRAQSQLDSGQIQEAFPVLARLLRDNPSNRLAAELLAGHLAGRRMMPIQSVPALHTNGPLRLWFSRDGSQLVSWARDGRSLAAFPVDRGALLRARFTKPFDRVVLDAGLGPDGRDLLVATADQLLRLDSASGEPRQPAWKLTSPLAAAAIDPGNTIRAVLKDGSLGSWTESGATAWRTNLPPLAGPAAFDPHGTRVATADSDGQLRVRDSVLGSEILATPAPPRLRSIVWDHAGRRLALVSDSPGLHVHSVDASAAVRRIPGADSLPPVTAVAFALDGQRLASAHADLTLRQWHLADGRAAADPIRIEAPLTRLSYARDDQFLAGQDANGSVQLWDLSVRNPSAVRNRSTRQQGWAVDPRSGLIASSHYEGSIVLMEPESRVPLHTRLSHGGPISTAALSPDGLFSATAGEDGTLLLWSNTTATGTRLASTNRPPVGVTDCLFSPDASLLATASQDGSVRLWNVASGLEVGGPMSHSDVASALRFSPDGSVLASASHDGSVRLWNRQAESLGPPLKRTGAIYLVQFSPDGSLLLTAGEGKSTQLWSVFQRQLLLELPTGSGVSAASFQSDGRLLVTGHFNGLLSVWDTVSGQRIGTPFQHTAQIVAAHFTPDGRSILFGSRSGHAGVWNFRDPTSPPSLITHPSAVVAVTPLPGGARIVCACEDGSIHLWDAASGLDLFKPAPHTGPIRFLATDPSGRNLLTASADGATHWQELPTVPSPVPSWLPALAESLAAARIDDAGNLVRLDDHPVRITGFLRQPPPDAFARSVWRQIAPPSFRDTQAGR